MYYIYILYSAGSDLYYVGYSSDYNRRLQEHNEQVFSNTFTAKHRPWILKAVFEAGDDEGAAMRIEKFIKKQKSRKLIEQIIIAEKSNGKLSGLVGVPYVRD